MASPISRIGQKRRRPRWLAQGLDDLLARRPGQAATWLSWLRNAPQSPAERNILRLIGRLAYPARSNIQRGSGCQPAQHEHLRSEERRVGKSVSVRVDLGGRRIIKKKNKIEHIEQSISHVTNNRNNYQATEHKQY